MSFFKKCPWFEERGGKRAQGRSLVVILNHKKKTKKPELHSCCFRFSAMKRNIYSNSAVRFAVRWCIDNLMIAAALASWSVTVHAPDTFARDCTDGRKRFIVHRVKQKLQPKRVRLNLRRGVAQQRSAEANGSLKLRSLV